MAGAALGVPTVELLVESIGHGLLSTRDKNNGDILLFATCHEMSPTIGREILRFHWGKGNIPFEDFAFCE